MKALRLPWTVRARWAVSDWARQAVRWAIYLVCGLVVFWALCVAVYLAIVLFIFAALVQLIRGALGSGP